MATPLGALVIPAPVQAAADCAGLAGGAIPGGTIVGAQHNAAAEGLPAHCEIVGRLNQRTGALGLPYSIGFRLRMPDDWNGRFYFQGGGGTDATLGTATGNASPDNQPVRLAQGYAIVSTDSGHDNTLDNLPDAGGTVAFGTDPQARLDYGYNAAGTVTPIAKEIVRAYYGRDPEYSYFDGCSNGGRQGMVASRRFPDYFDGILAGNPGFNLPAAAVTQAWNEQALAPLATRLDVNGQPYLPDTFSDADLAVASDAVLTACDALDGLQDGIVDNWRACTSARVHPALDAVQCQGGGQDGCLSAGQIQALKTIWAGPYNSRGQALYADWQWEPGLSGPTSLRVWSLGTPAAPDQPLVTTPATPRSPGRCRSCS